MVYATLWHRAVEQLCLLFSDVAVPTPPNPNEQCIAMVCLHPGIRRQGEGPICQLRADCARGGGGAPGASLPVSTPRSPGLPLFFWRSVSRCSMSVC